MPLELWVSLTIWVGLMFFAFFIELQTSDIISLVIIFSSFITAIFSFFNNDGLWQLLVFSILAVTMSFSFYPIMRKKQTNKVIDINDSRLVSKVLKVVEMNNDGVTPIVRDSGVKWEVLSNDQIKKGDKVKIIKIEGNKLHGKLVIQNTKE